MSQKKLEFFKKIPIFKEVPESELHFLVEISYEFSLSANKKLITIGKSIDRMYFLREGSLSINVLTQKQVETLKTLNKFEIVGEMELFERRPSVATVITLEECFFYIVMYDAFYKHWQSLPYTYMRLVELALSRWTRVESRYQVLVDELEEVSKLALEQQVKIENEAKLNQIFIENISHDLRTPLTIIQGVIEGLEPNIDEKQKISYSLDKSMFSILKRSYNYLLNLINDLLDVSQISKRFFKLDYSYHDLSTEFDDILEMMKPLIANKKLSLKFSNQIEKNFLFYTDSNRLRQVIYNLLTNSIKYTTEGYIDVTLKSKKVSKRKHEIKILVKDTGIGMSQNDIDIIFDKFTRGESATFDFKGTGLGLFIVDSIVKLMKGKIKVDSKINKGSSFTISIPMVCKIKKGKNLGGNLTSEAETYRHLTNKNILIIDDFEDTHTIIKALLKQYPIIIDSLYSGTEISESNLTKQYDAILIDLMMPELDGYQVLKFLRNNYKPKEKTKTQFIAFTALSSEKEIKKVKKNGFDNYLLKPFNKKTLINVIFENIKYI